MATPRESRFANYRRHGNKWLPSAEQACWVIDGAEEICWKGRMQRWELDDIGR